LNIGYLVVNVTTGGGDLSIQNAHITVRQPGGAVLYEDDSDASGISMPFSLPAPDVKHTLDPYYMQPAYSLYDVDVSADGYVMRRIHDVEIVDTQTAILPVDLEPLTDEPNPQHHSETTLAPVALLSGEEKKHLGPDITANVRAFSQGWSAPTAAAGVSHRDYTDPAASALPVMASMDNAVPTPAPAARAASARTVVIPDYITVHLGTPANASAKNVRVKFPDYIKNKRCRNRQTLQDKPCKVFL